MAFMAHGHMAGEGKYGKRLERATEYVIGCQKANGLVTRVGPDGPEIRRDVEHDIGVTAAYNHAISSLMLSEVYGSSKGDPSPRLKKAISNSIAATLKMQRWSKERPIDRGGWRYLDDFNEQDSDLSITGWELMFLRSARNAGFDVPNQSIEDAVRYVRRTFSERYGAFGYIADKYDFRSRGMAGAGILALAHAGLHGTPEEVRSGNWLLGLNFDNYNETVNASHKKIGTTTATTTACSFAARECTSLAASIGRSFTRELCKRYSPTNGRMALGLRRAISTTPNMATRIRRHSSSYVSVHQTSFCPSFSDNEASWRYIFVWRLFWKVCCYWQQRPLHRNPPLRRKPACGHSRASSNRANDGTPANVLTPGQWRRVDAAVGRP